MEHFDATVRYRGSLQNYPIDAGDEGILADTVFEPYDFSKQEASGKYVCSICGYVYDPAEHDGVAFEDLPDDWRCPRCKQPKEKFNKA